MHVSMARANRAEHTFHAEFGSHAYSFTRGCVLRIALEKARLLTCLYR